MGPLSFEIARKALGKKETSRKPHRVRNVVVGATVAGLVVGAAYELSQRMPHTDTRQTVTDALTGVQIDGSTIFVSAQGSATGRIEKDVVFNGHKVPGLSSRQSVEVQAEINLKGEPDAVTIGVEANPTDPTNFDPFITVDPDLLTHDLSSEKINPNPNNTDTDQLGLRIVRVFRGSGAVAEGYDQATQKAQETLLEDTAPILDSVSPYGIAAAVNDRLEQTAETLDQLENKEGADALRELATSPMKVVFEEADTSDGKAVLDSVRAGYDDESLLALTQKAAADIKKIEQRRRVTVTLPKAA